MRRIAVAAGLAVVVALAVFVVGVHRASPVASTEPVALLTGVDSCWAGGAPGDGGLLTADAAHGTSLRGKPVMWPVGYSARRAGSEVEVLNAKGAVVATTGRVYYFAEARVSDPSKVNTETTYLASADCPYFWSLIDCTAVAQATREAPADSDLGQQRSYCSQILPG